MLRKSMVALAVAGITVFATPAAAFAATELTPAGECAGVGSENYAVASVVTADRSVIEGGDTVNVVWEDGYFMPGAPVTVVTDGSAAGRSQLSSGGASSSESMTGVSSSAGSLEVAVTVDPDATGSITISGMAECGVGGVTVEVVDPSTAALADSDADPAEVLAFTGSSIPVVLLIAGAGAVAFGSILLAARARGRRSTQE